MINITLLLTYDLLLFDFVRLYKCESSLSVSYAFTANRWTDFDDIWYEISLNPGDKGSRKVLVTDCITSIVEGIPCKVVKYSTVFILKWSPCLTLHCVACHRFDFHPVQLFVWSLNKRSECECSVCVVFCSLLIYDFAHQTRALRLNEPRIPRLAWSFAQPPWRTASPATPQHMLVSLHLPTTFFTYALKKNNHFVELNKGCIVKSRCEHCSLLIY